MKRANRYNLLLSVFDVLAIIITSILTHLITYSDVSVREIYSPVTIYMSGCIVISGNMMKLYDKFIERSIARELTNISKQYLIEEIFLVLYTLNNFHTEHLEFIGISFFIGILITLVFRESLKKIVRYYYAKTKHCRNLMIVTTLEKLENTVKHFLDNEDVDFNVFAITVIDAPDDFIGTKVNEIEVTANMGNIEKYSVNAPIDEVYVNIGYHNNSMQKIIEMFEIMGATVHVELNSFNYKLPNARVEKISGTSVLTVSNNIISSYQAFMKRTIDIIGGFIGCIVTLILCIFIVPMIKLQDSGSAFFSQVRVGKNGRKFKMYKFRSMYMDAEERKKELINSNSNEMKSDMMFKMKDDPRIIPKIGHFIRKTSIDEFPQFLNVLKGDMSLVGTRPPTVDEFEKYSLHHKNRLSFKPGLTGLWQVSGRSDITDFEEVVRLDSDYISNWSIGLDIKILFKTIVNVIARKGAG